MLSTTSFSSYFQSAVLTGFIERVLRSRSSRPMFPFSPALPSLRLNLGPARIFQLVFCRNVTSVDGLSPYVSAIPIVPIM